MDCIDCHNRPTHIYNSPMQAVNLEMSTGRLNTTLPWLKKNVVEVLAAEYDSTGQALDSIATILARDYREQPDTALVYRTITEVQKIYRNNFFPEMKTDWRAHPDNIGHSIYPGCYRCHDGKHKTDDGRVISKKCTTCHLIIGQGGAAESRLIGPEGLEFQHPVGIGEMWKQMPCTACHSGRAP